MNLWSSVDTSRSTCRTGNKHVQRKRKNGNVTDRQPKGQSWPLVCNFLPTCPSSSWWVTMSWLVTTESVRENTAMVPSPCPHHTSTWGREMLEEQQERQKQEQQEEQEQEHQEQRDRRR